MSEIITHKVPKEEINDWFETTYSEFIAELFYKLKEKCDNQCIGVLENENNTTLFEFQELIKNNIDIISAFKKKYRI